MKTRFTVIIPTRERADTLKYCLESVLAQRYDNFCVIVSDNASEDDTESVVKSFNDERIKYINTGRRISMSENFEFALDHVTDGWVTVLGDDDGLIPGALEKVDSMIKETGVRALRSNTDFCGYAWPRFTGEDHGALLLDMRKGYTIVNSSMALNETLKGMRPYPELPIFYDGGFVDFDLIRAAKSVTGTFFRSITPDVYSGVVFSLLTDCYVYLREPLVISGVSHHSNGTSHGFLHPVVNGIPRRGRNRTTSEKEEREKSYNPAQKFFEENTIPFHADLPLLSNSKPVRSIQAIVLEAYLQAAPFHKPEVHCPSYSEQLAIILRDGGPDHDEISEWAIKFALLHNISLDEAVNQSNNLRRKRNGFTNRLRHFWIRVTSTIKVKASRSVPIKNVYEAGILAGYILDNRPAVFRLAWGNIAGEIYRRIIRILKPS